MKNKSNKRLGFKYHLGIREYPNNAAKNFSYLRIIIYMLISIILAVMLVITTIGKGYGPMALLFTGIAFVLIAGYAILNIMALIIKSKS